MDGCVIFMVNEDGEAYMRCDDLMDAARVLADYPEDSIVIVREESFYARQMGDKIDALDAQDAQDAAEV